MNANQLVAIEPEALISKAIEAAVPVEALERLLAMRAELRAERAREAFAHALANFQAEIPAIPKRRVAKINSRGGGAYTYRYADIADIQAAIAKALQRAGLSVTFETEHDDHTLVVTCVVHHVGGHSERASFPVPIDRSARMSAIQQIGSALTYGRRYALCAALGIVTAEEDDDGATATVSETHAAAQAAPHRPAQSGDAPHGQKPGRPRSETGGTISEQQHRRLEARIRDLGLDRERVKRWISRAWGVAHMTQIPSSRYNELDQRLEKWAQKTVQSDDAPDGETRAAMQEARKRGWDGSPATLPQIVEQLRQHAKHVRQRALRADRSHGSEIDDADRADRIAARLEPLCTA